MMDGESKRERDDEAAMAGAGDTEVPETEAAETAAPADGGDGDDVEIDIPVIEDLEIPSIESDSAQVARLEAELAQYKDKLLRQAAETENVRRRLQRDKDDAVRYAALPLIRDLLGVVDNLERALDSLPEDAAAGDGPLAQLVAGLELTRKELAAVFERHQVVPIAAQGERLDPNRHEAMFEVEDPSVPAGTVVQVLQTGYMMHDRLVRAARVGVAKGGPPPGPSPANDPGDPAGPEPGTHLDTEA